MSLMHDIFNNFRANVVAVGLFLPLDVLRDSMPSKLENWFLFPSSNSWTVPVRVIKKGTTCNLANRQTHYPKYEKYSDTWICIHVTCINYSLFLKISIFPLSQNRVHAKINVHHF